MSKPISFTLDCQTEVRVVAFSFGYTYSGLLSPLPSDRINQFIYDTASYPNNWGKRKHLKLTPQMTEFVPGVMGLKDGEYSVWLESKFTDDQNSDGTLLVVTWFDDEPENKLISDIIYQGVRGINWLEEAEGFNY